MKAVVKAIIGWDGKTEQEKYLWRYKLASVTGRLIAIFPLPLWWLFNTFGSDKHQPGWHSYGFSYGALFRKWKYKRVKMLEIGIGGYNDSLGGRSLLAWQAYFPFGTIVAADIVPKQVLAGGRVQVHQVDQSSAEQLAGLKRATEPFDIIIDDGSHFNSHQILTFEVLFDALKDGGIYVIEDVQTSFWPGLIKGVAWDGSRIAAPEFAGTCYGYFLELAKYLNHAEFVDGDGESPVFRRFGSRIIRISFEHNLIIIHKGQNTERSAFVGA